ncbi:MAG: TetR/AcrR family transcriptional regulator [Ruminococcaceae bacterium]|nr:TetR/AcrR family transcriptional regulator [Oscillospiraceae bacterium]
MPKRSGRPPRADREASRQQIIAAAARLIREQGAERVTVRSVCQEADMGTGTFYYYFRDKDDLLMVFLRELNFEDCALETSAGDPAGRLSELWMMLVDRLETLGLDFMNTFYSTKNKALTAFLGETDGAFAPGTVLARCEEELAQARQSGALRPDADVRQLALDACTVVKGCLFDWCLTDGRTDLRRTVPRLLRALVTPSLPEKKPAPTGWNADWSR